MSTDEERTPQVGSPSPDELWQALEALEATMDGGQGAAGYQLPPEVAQHIAPDLPAWDGMDAYEAWRRDHAAWWEAEGQKAAALEYLSPAAYPPPPA